MSAPKSNDPGIFLTAFWDELAESERCFPVKWRVALERSHSKRVLEVSIQVLDVDKLPLERVLVWTRASWPNSHVSTLEAFLYQQAHKTARQVEATCGEVVRYERTGRKA